MGAIGVLRNGHQGVAFKADQRDADGGIGRGDDGSNLVVGNEPVTDSKKKLGRLVRGSGDIGGAASFVGFYDPDIFGASPSLQRLASHRGAR
jgi:hypothetical protein